MIKIPVQHLETGFPNRVVGIGTCGLRCFEKGLRAMRFDKKYEFVQPFAELERTHKASGHTTTPPKKSILD